MNRGVVKDLCESIGTMNKSMESAEVKGGSFMRVKSFGGRILTFVLWSSHLIGVRGWAWGRFGYLSNTKEYQTFATGVDV